MRITPDANSIKKILRLIKATIVLHNILIEFGDDSVEENEIDFDDFSDLDDWERVPYEDGDILNSRVPLGGKKDERRQQLLEYFEEHVWLHRALGIEPSIQLEPYLFLSMAIIGSFQCIHSNLHVWDKGNDLLVTQFIFCSEDVIFPEEILPEL
jgi:hypothetical protein